MTVMRMAITPSLNASIRLVDMGRDGSCPRQPSVRAAVRLRRPTRGGLAPRGRSTPTASPSPARPAGVVRAPAGARDLAVLDARVSGCRACPRLVAWREEVARVKRASFRDWDYWGRPVPGLGPADARIAVVGLAPAAHGGNRTGRVFTGDRSGDWIFAALWRAGLANQPTSTHIGDGLELTDVRVAAAVRCAPPANAPTPEERDTCSPWLARELALLPRLRVIVVLGGFGWTALWPVLGRRRVRAAPARGRRSGTAWRSS